MNVSAALESYRAALKSGPARRMNIPEDARERGRAKSMARAERRVREHGPVVAELRGVGLSLAAIAAILNDNGYRAPMGREFRGEQVRFILSRYEP